jgi:hypothetical protein
METNLREERKQNFIDATSFREPKEVPVVRRLFIGHFLMRNNLQKSYG